MNPNGETLGDYLKREREVRRVSVEEIALWLSADRRMIDALEDNDFELFSQRSECAQLLKHYATYLNLDQTDVSRRFGVQWKLTGGRKRYPKLTYFAEGDPSPVMPTGFKKKRRPIGFLPLRKRWLPFVLGVPVVGFVLWMYLPGMRELPLPRSQQSRDAHEKAAPAVVPGVPPAATAPANNAPLSAAAPRAQAGASRDTVSPPAKNVRVIGNRDSKRYHLPGMKYYDKVKAYHRVAFQSEREAINAGYAKAAE